MREFINIIVNEGRAYDIDTGYGGAVRTTRVYMNPVTEQAATLAKSAMKVSGLLYLRGILYEGKRLYVGDGHAVTHHDLIQEFLPGVEERESSVTTFEVTNYKMQGITPSMTEATLYTAKPGDYDVETNPHALKLMEGCKMVSPAPMAEGLIEGPYEDGRVLPRTEEGKAPVRLYRIMSNAEYQDGVKRGTFGVRDRIHASAEPHFEFCEPGDQNVLISILYNDADGWKAKQTLGMGVVAITDNLPADRVELLAKGTRADLERGTGITEDEDEDEYEARIARLPSVEMLEPLLPELAEAAQKVYDLWDQDEDGYDEDMGSGGICHLIADQVVHIISAAGGHVYSVSDNFEVHVYAVAAFKEGVFQIDIPHRLYERGGGYTWTKLPGVHFSPQDIYINKIDGDPTNIGQYVEDAEEEFYEEVVTEAPVGDWTIDPDFDSNEKEMLGKFHGYEREQKHWSDSDKAALRDPGNIERVKSAFNKTPATFNLYFYQANDPDYDPFMQKGVVDLNWVRKHMGETAAKTIVVRPGQITIVMSNNLSDEGWIGFRSPWIVAHRIGHTLIMGEQRIDASYEVMHLFDKFVEGISSYGYGVKWPKGDDYHSTIFRDEYMEVYRKVLGHALGTMRSARSKKLVQSSEWIMETFAQYIMTGKVTLYELPSEIHPDEQLTTDPQKLEKVQKIWTAFPVKIKKAFDKLLKEAEGQIWVI